MSDIIFLSNVRLSFPHLAEPQKQVNEATGATRISYNAEFLMPQDHPGFAQFMARYGAIALQKWKEHAQAVMQMIQNDRKTRCFGRGEEKISRKTMQPYDGYAGNIYITAGRDTAPQMIQADGSPVDPANTMAYQQLARKMYGGCRVNAAIKPWPQDNKVGRGIRCDLIAVQFAGDDTPFGEGATDASGLFGAVAGGAPAGFGGANPYPAMPAAPFAQPGLPSFLGGQ
jgi:hypothetical protein